MFNTHKYIYLCICIIYIYVATYDTCMYDRRFLSSQFFFFVHSFFAHYCTTTNLFLEFFLSFFFSLTASSPPVKIYIYASTRNKKPLCRAVPSPHTTLQGTEKYYRRYFKENHLFLTVTSFSSQLRPTRVVHHAHSSSARPLTNHAHCSPRQHALNLSPS